MKFKVIFLRKKYMIIWILIISTILIILSIYARITGISSVFNVEEDKSYKIDLTGDGEKDILNIKVMDKKYYLSVDSKGTSFQLSPIKNGESVGNYSKEWPLNILIEDINRDNIPEIFSQSSIKSKSYMNIFMYNGKEFENILSSSTCILGIYDLSNNKTPKILSGNIINNKISLNNYIMVNNKLQQFDYNYKDNYLGKDTVLKFIKYMGNVVVNENEEKEMFSTELPSIDRANIGLLFGNNSKYIFQDGYFKDIKSDNNGEMIRAEWKLNFSSTVNNSQNKNLNITIKLKKEGEDSLSFKIYSLKIK